MSLNPDEPVADTYTPASWHESNTPEADASRALEHGDPRLLAFASRNISIPGIEAAETSSYQERCGIRFLEGFGDVVRSEQQLEDMKRARSYALRYNRVIVTECSPAR